MKILRFEAENFKRLKCVRIDAVGSVVQITGANASGKSSVLDAIYAAVAGKSASPGTPIRTGETSARITLDLGKFIITRKFTAAGSYLTVETEDGAKFSSPQAMLDALIGELTFDPLEFTRMKPREQRDTLARVAGLSGSLRELADADKRDFEERTAVNRDLRTAKARLDAMEHVDAVEPVDMQATLAEIREARAERDRISMLQLKRDDTERQIARWRHEATEKRQEAARLLLQADDLENSAQVTAERLEAAEPLPEKPDITPLEQRLEQAEAINAQHRAHLALVRQQASVRQLEIESQSITDRMASRESQRAAMIQAAAFPVPGIGLTEEGVTLNGLPLEQASGAQQLQVSLAIAMSANPKLRVLRVKDGSLLDEQSLAIVRDMVRDQDFQLWIERVDTSGRVGVVMVDGEVQEDPFANVPELSAVGGGV